MRVVILTLAFLLATLTICFAGERVPGYMRDSNHDGVKDTWVNPYERTTPNSSWMDNYSYPGNFNPNKGQFTLRSHSPRDLYPFNPNPYEKPRNQKYGW